jgi:transcriptional regulator with XRE-family HTH domain
METPFGSLNAFLAGSVFKAKKLPGTIRSQIATLRKRRQLAATSVRVLLSASVVAGAMASSSMHVVPLVGGTFEWRIGFSDVSQIGRGIEDLGQRVKNAREFFEMSQREAAQVLHVSESSLEKLEQGATSRPSDSLVRRYLALVDLMNVHASTLKGNWDASIVYCRAPSVLWDGQSAFEYAKRTDGSAIFEVLAAHRRMIG